MHMQTISQSQHRTLDTCLYSMHMQTRRCNPVFFCINIYEGDVNSFKHMQGGHETEWQCDCLQWQYRTPAHGAELTAGYWNTSARNGYEDVFDLMRVFGGNISFTCVEMRDCEHGPDARSSPEGLLNQIFLCSEQYGARPALCVSVVLFLFLFGFLKGDVCIPRMFAFLICLHSSC